MFFVFFPQASQALPSDLYDELSTAALDSCGKLMEMLAVNAVAFKRVQAG